MARFTTAPGTAPVNLLTSETAASGTDRVAEVAALLDAELIVNVQGDEPLIEPSTIDAAIQPLIEVALGIYFTATVLYALANGIYGSLPFLVLFQVGFLYTGLMSLFQQVGGDDLLVKAPQIAGGK